MFDYRKYGLAIASGYEQSSLTCPHPTKRSLTKINSLHNIRVYGARVVFRYSSDFRFLYSVLRIFLKLPNGGGDGGNVAASRGSERESASVSPR